MSAVVHDCQRLLVYICVVIYSLLKLHKEIFGFCYALVLPHKDVHVFVKAVILNVCAEDFHVLLDFWEVYEAFLLGISVLVYSHEADSRVVNVA